MRIALTGITSGVGRRFAEVALERGHDVVGLVRQPDREDARSLKALGVALIAGQLLDGAALAELCDSADVLIHMAAHVGDWGDPSEFERVNVGGAEAALRAAARAGVRRFVHLSSVSVYGRPRRGRVTEEWPHRRTGIPYDDSKIGQEELVFGLGAELGLQVCAVRPPVIYGPYDRNFMPRTLAMVRARRMLLIDGGHAPFNLVWVDHVVDLLLLCAHEDAAVGEAFNVMDSVSERPPSVREVGAAVARAAGLPEPNRAVPRALAMAAGFVLDKVFRLARSTSPPPVTPFVVRLLTLDIIYDSAKAERLLGWQPRLGSIEGVERFAREFAARGM